MILLSIRIGTSQSGQPRGSAHDKKMKIVTRQKAQPIYQAASRSANTNNKRIKRGLSPRGLCLSFLASLRIIIGTETKERKSFPSRVKFFQKENAFRQAAGNYPPNKDLINSELQFQQLSWFLLLKSSSFHINIHDISRNFKAKRDASGVLWTMESRSNNSSGNFSLKKAGKLPKKNLS